jgi:hypothetical protein
MLASFLGVLPILTPPLCALAFIMCSKSNPLVVCVSSSHVAFQTLVHMLSHTNSGFYQHTDIHIDINYKTA